jgi:Flp pilus assembly protein TadD
MGVVGFTHSIASDKYTYLPAIGLLLIAAWGLGFAWDAVSRRPSQRVGHALIVVAAVILAGFEITATRRQLAHWQDTEGHFRYMLTLAPNARVLHFGLGDALRQKAQAERSSKLFDEAAREYELATRPGADSPFGRNDLLTCAAHNNLANILALHGQIDQAVKHWRRVLEMNPEDYKAHNNLAIALSMQGKTEEAIAHYTEALRLRPNLADAHNALGALLAKRGDLGPAIPHFTEALRLQPNSPAALRNLEATLTRQGRSPDEIQSYLRSLGIIRPSAPARRTR